MDEKKQILLRLKEAHVHNYKSDYDRMVTLELLSVLVDIRDALKSLEKKFCQW